MTENNENTTEVTADQPETAVDAPETPTASEGTSTDPKAAKEAARYRRQLRAAESERDALAEQVTALRRAAVEDRLKAQHVPAAGFWAAGVQLDDLLDDDGNLDDEKITEAADRAVETLGLERVGVHMRPVPGEGRTTSPSPTPSWEAAFAPK